MTYIVAELGGTHNGSLATAKRLIDAVAGPVTDHHTGEELPGVDAVKFTARDLSHEYTVAMRDSLYEGPHSYGRTYGEHREALELDRYQLEELRRVAEAKGLEMGLTMCHPNCFNEYDATPEWYKVASRDLSNGPLLERLSEESIPIVVSTGMATWQDLSTALDILKHNEVVLLHCLSQYPAQYNQLNMSRIKRLQRLGYRVGYSSHTADDWMAVTAVGMGCEWVELHVTLSRQMRGTDHAASLEPDGLRRLVGRIRHLEQSLGSQEDTSERRDAYRAAQQKLGRSICTSRDIMAGEVLDADCTELLSPGTGFSWHQRAEVYGKVAAVDITEQTLLTPDVLLARVEMPV